MTPWRKHLPEDSKDFTWLYFPAERDKMEQALEELSARLADQENDPGLSSKIRLILEEIMLNIINHAYKGNITGPVHIGWKVNSDGSRTVRFIDSGEEFNPLQKEPPDIEAGIEDRPIGGLGIHLVRQISRETDYRRIGNENILTVRI